LFEIEKQETIFT